MKAVVGEFDTAEALVAGLGKARAADLKVVDVFAPYPLPQAAGELAPDRRHVRLWSAAAAAAAAVVAYGAQWWSSVRAYPFDTGSRPLNSWPVYVLTTFEIAVLAAALAGFAAFLLKSGLPRLHHPAFDLAGFERASQDRFFLVLSAPPRDAPGVMKLIAFLREQGAVEAREAEL